MNDTENWESLSTEAHAWVLRNGSRGLGRKYLGWLSGEEIQRLGKMTRESVRREYLATRTLCRAVLSRYAGVGPSEWKFEVGRHGKPRILGPRGFASLQFNLTHTKGMIICLVTRAGNVGVDVEETSRVVDIDDVARISFSPAERVVLTKLAGVIKKTWFFEQWVLKEAYLKGLGAGMLREPSGFTIERDEDDHEFRIGKWQLTLKRLGQRHAAATAIRGEKNVPIKWMDAKALFKAGVAVV